MPFPFRIIEANISNRNQFDLTECYQPTHALFYLKSGSFDMEIEGIKETVHPGDCLILPDYLHFRRSVTNPIEFVYVKFTDVMSCPFSLNLPYGKVIFKDEKRFAYNIKAIEQLLYREDPLSINYREHLLQDILFQISLSHKGIDPQSESSIPHNKIVASAIEYIKEHITEKILIEDICRAIGSNSSTLNFNFRREFDLSVGQYMLDERMKRAKRLLIGTTYSISEIAKRCGFENIYYFSNAFKKVFGVSPSEFKVNYA